MKKLVWVLLGVLTFIFTPVTSVRAETNQRGLLLAEVQTGSVTSASEEFIELYNASGRSLDLSTFRVEYFSAGAPNFNEPSRTIPLAGMLYPEGRYLITSAGYLAAQADVSFSATLAKTGGHLRIINELGDQKVVHDLVGWGTAMMPETSAATAPNGGESLQRKTLDDGSYQDTDNNAEDFTTVAPTPESVNPEPAPGDEEPNEDPVEEIPPTETEGPSEPNEPAPEVPVTEPETVLLLPIQITELLPNPASPLTDADDEFIELYNPNNEAVDLRSYRLETGNSYSYRFTFDTQVIEAHSYLVLYSRDSGLVLSNSGGKARLLDPSGMVVSEAMPYDKADEGASWAIVGGVWQWTISPTAGIDNLLTTSPLPTPKVTTPKSKKTPTAKPKAAKQVKAKTASAKSSKAKKASENVAKIDTPSGKKLPLNASILAAIGIIALTYAAYEYRTDIANQFHKLRDYRKHRGGNGKAS